MKNYTVKNLGKLPWGGISGWSTGIGLSVGVAAESWPAGIVVMLVIAAFMIWLWRERLTIGDAG